jgi:hypothetical protein
MSGSTKYYWKIIPIIDGVPATGCPTWEFTTGVIPKCAENPNPINGATCVMDSVNMIAPILGLLTLSWAPVAGATSYKLQYGPDASLSTPSTTTTTITPPNPSTPPSNSFPVPVFPATFNDPQFYWKVTPIFDGVEATGCEVWNFTWACDACPPPAQPSAISGDTSVCEGSIQTYSVGNVAGVNYTWSVPTGWSPISGQGTNSITVTVGTSASGGTITVVPDNSCGEGTGRTLLVKVNPTYLDEDVRTICANELPYEYGDSVFTSAGSKNVYFKTINGCDSIIRVSLMVNDSVINHLSLTLCANQLPYTWRDTTFDVGTPSHLFTFSKQTALDRKSVV